MKPRSPPRKKLGYKPQIKGWQFWSAMTLLTAVDWIANVPIFSELYNNDADFTQRLRDLTLKAADSGLWSGLYMTGGRVLLSPEASILALGTVIFLMLLAHYFGKNLRRLVSLSSKDGNEGQTTPQLRSLRREAKWPCCGTAAGLVLMLSFLFFTRQMIGPMSRERFNEKASQVMQQQANVAKAEAKGDAEDEQVQLDKKSKAQHQQDILQDRTDMANGISRVNGPMLLLNIVLVICATSLAYFHDEVSVTESNAVDPTLILLEEKVRKLHEEKLNQQTVIQVLDREIQESLSTAHHLAQARPLSNWAAKAHRLSCAINLYRTENARLRGVDVHNINAFRTDCHISWPTVMPGDWYSLPNSYSVAEREHQDLRGEYLRLSSGTSRS